MFTGIITEVVRVKSIKRQSASWTISASSEKSSAAAKIGDSISINGVCLTVTGIKNNTMSFDVIKNTLQRTNLKRLKIDSPVNLEHALKSGDPISGHFVSGHIDLESKIRNNRKTTRGHILEIEVPPVSRKLAVPKGSIAVDGISLTIGEVGDGSVRIFIIPHTMANTTLSIKKKGDYVNVEFDMMAKYSTQNTASLGKITKDLLSEKGFI